MTPSKTYSFADSAERVLEKFGDKQPMHYREVTDRAIEVGWLVSKGKTPGATMYAQIITEIKRRRLRGEQPRFVQHGRGLVGLTKWTKQGLDFEVEQHNKRIRAELLKRLLDMEWSAFEDLIPRVLVGIGFEDIEVTSKSNDGGIDVRGTLVVGGAIRTRMAIQVKKWRHNILKPTVQQVRGSLGAHEQGLIITTSDFSAGARREADRPDATPVALMDGKQLVDLLVEYEIGVRHRTNVLIELNKEDDLFNFLS